MSNNEYERLIEHSVSKWIQFNYISKEETIKYITDNTYFFRVYAYRKTILRIQAENILI